MYCTVPQSLNQDDVLITNLKFVLHLNGGIPLTKLQSKPNRDQAF